MRNNRILTVAIIAIIMGFIGFAVSSLFFDYRGFAGIPTASGMDGCMGRGHMKDMMQRMMPGMLPPAVKSEDLPDPNSKGAKLLVYYCTQCHGLPSPKMHSAEDWTSITNRMFARMSMMSGMMGVENPALEERQAIVAYLKANTIKSIHQGDLPTPESKGALLFKDTCSQCHALPDPKVHTAEEWRQVVKRMRTNMESMEKRTISDDEAAEIVNYLGRIGRK